jgi:hypothetical protein
LENNQAGGGRLMSKIGQALPRAHREKMFQEWCECQNLMKIAKKYKHAYSTVHRMYKRFHWRTRYTRIQTGYENKVDKEVEKNIVGNLEYIKALKSRVLIELIGKDKYGEFNKKKINPTISDVIKIIELEEKLKGNLPEGAERGTIVNYIQLQQDERSRVTDDDLAIIGALRANGRL